MALKGEINSRLEQAKKELVEDLANNPSFDDAISKEYKYIFFKTQSTDIDIKVSPDKKSVSLTSFNSVVDCSIPELRGLNQAYINSKIYLKEDNMYVEYSQGVLFDRNDLEKKGFKTYANYESKFETLYSLTCYDKYGFEYSNSSYSDNYPINKPVKELDIIEQTNSSFHKPTFNEYMLPMHPIHMLKASVRNMYRKKDSYSVIHINAAKITTNGYENVMCALYTTHPLNSRLLRGAKCFAKSVEHEGRYIFLVEKDYAESIELAYEKAKEEFKEELKKNKKEYDKESYDYIIENC